MPESDLRQIAALVSRLLSHYWTADDPEPTRRAQIEDWLEDLREFGPAIVAEACGEWRRAQHRRPTIADIRALAVMAQAGHRSGEEPISDLREDKSRRVETARQRDEQMQRDGRAVAAAWARRQGYETMDAYAAAKGIHWSQAYRMVIAENLAGSPVGTALSGAAALGVTAREFMPSPESMAEGRRELGLEERE